MWIARSCVMALIGAMVVPCVHVGAAEQWRLIPIDVDGITNATVTDFVIGADGTPWVTVPGREPAVCFWREGRWRRIDGEYSIDPHTSQLHLSPTGRVYLSQTMPHGYRRGGTPPKPHFGALYLLENTEAKYITEFYYERSHFQRPLFFDSKGRIWNWGTMFLAKYEDGQWERVEANIGWRASIIEDADGNVYCFGTTVSYWRDGRFTVNVKAPSFSREQPAFKGYLWGTDKALLIASGDRGAVVLDLGTMTVSDVLDSRPLPDSVMRELYADRARGETRQSVWQNLPLMARSTFWDGFRDTQGNVWLLTHTRSSPNYFYVKVCVADNRVEERLETAAIDWGNGMGSARKPVLCAKDGAIYFGASRDGVYLYRNGELTHVSWQQGLAINHTRWVCEHPDRTIWFASRRMGIAVYDPRGVPGTGPTSPFQTSWEEYPLAARPMLRDFEGHLWCCPKNQSGKISRWDGQAWEHFDVGDNMSYLRCLWADNLQRLHVVGPGGPDRFACRLTKGRLERFADFKEMLLDSVRTGAREFKGSGSGHLLTPLVVTDREIWCRDASARRLIRYSSGVWHDIEIDPFSMSLFKHKADQVLIRSRAGFMTWDRGQLIEFTNEQTRNEEYLLSESGLQPFDKDLYEAHPREFFPARRTKDAVYVFDGLTDFHDFQEDDVPPGTAKFSQYFDRIWLAEGGFWAHSDNLCELQRCYEGLLLRVDLAVTPVAADLGAGNCDAHEDVNGDLWIRRHQTLFRVKRPRLDTRIVAPQVTECTSPSLRIKFAGASDGPVAEPLRYAWRLDGGPWSTPTVQEHANLEFTRPGPHKFEVLSIGRMGNIDTTPATMTFNVELPVPEVRIVSAPQDLVTDLNVAIGCEIVKQSEGTAVTFQWRLDGGPWHDTQETTIRPSPLEDGEHLFEVRAVADHKFIQAAPASVKFTVRVDYEKAVALAVKDLGSTDYAEREAASRRLVSLGDKCLPHLKQELKNANEDMRWWIQAVISEIEGR
jgi:hypothetical protein